MAKDKRPEISPYAVPSIGLCFQGDITLYVPIHLLAQSHKLESMHLQDALQFVDVSPDIGHVLIHYLFTGTYQCLKPKNGSLQEKVATEFITSVGVYNAAQAYALLPLVELAKAEIERLGNRLRAPLVFDLMRDAYPNPSTDDLWLNGYLKARLSLFLKSSPGSLVGEITGERKSMSISEILFESMFELLHEDTVLLRNEHKDTGNLGVQLLPGPSKEHLDGILKKEDEIQKDNAFGDVAIFASPGTPKEDKIKSDDTQPLTEVSLEVKSAQYFGASEEKKDDINPRRAVVPKEKEKKGENNNKNNAENSAVVDPTLGPSEDCLLVKTEQGAKDENSVGLGEDPCGLPASKKGEEKDMKLRIKPQIPVSSNSDKAAEYEPEAKTESDWSFWGLGRKEGNKIPDSLPLQPQPPKSASGRQWVPPHLRRQQPSNPGELDKQSLGGYRHVLDLQR
ncbi:hypothetical protein V8C37DRAFT_363904 [Trichoderma ceciliae]